MSPEYVHPSAQTPVAVYAANTQPPLPLFETSNSPSGPKHLSSLSQLETSSPSFYKRAKAPNVPGVIRSSTVSKVPTRVLPPVPKEGNRAQEEIVSDSASLTAANVNNSSSSFTQRVLTAVNSLPSLPLLHLDDKNEDGSNQAASMAQKMTPSPPQRPSSPEGQTVADIRRRKLENCLNSPNLELGKVQAVFVT